MVVNEIFKSIQGESTFIDLPCVFLRLTGCNLRCNWCDTAYAYRRGRKISLLKVVDKIKKMNTPLLEITGGEPLVQQDSVLRVIKRLPDKPIIYKSRRHKEYF